MSKKIHKIEFDNSFSRLGPNFYKITHPSPVSAPELIEYNTILAKDLGLSLQNNKEKIFSGMSLLEGSFPLSMVYAGHQFGGFSPQLGDGRAILLGEVVNKNGLRQDIQLKGSGPTAFSRRGDGRAALGPVLREYIVSEAMYSLGIPTTRSLAAVLTGDSVYRDAGALPGAILTRVASSHIRIGTFEYFAAKKDFKSLKILADYVIQRHYPSLMDFDNPYLSLLEKVIEKQAYLIVQWMMIGFIHGVMNTDNMSIIGETIDYGPCAFMDKFHPSTVYSFIDHYGRYAYGNQPKIARWNLARLAESLTTLISENSHEAQQKANDALDRFPDLFKTYYYKKLRDKLGLYQESTDDFSLTQELFQLMADHKADFTLTFRSLSDHNLSYQTSLSENENFKKWLDKLTQRHCAENRDPTLRLETMNNTNPCIIPRNHQIEKVIRKAEENLDFTDFKTLLKAIKNPYEKKTIYRHFQAPPLPEEEIINTFCGT